MADPTACPTRTLEGIIRGTSFRIAGIDETAQGLVQSFELQFQRKLTRVYDLTSAGFYYLEGPPEGTVTFTKIIGPKGAPKITCECTPKNIILSMGPMMCLGNTNGKDVSYTLWNALPFGLNGKGNAGDFLIAFGISYMFSDIT